MLPLHCGRCGRLIGRSEKREFEGGTVCVRCFAKLGGDDVVTTPKQNAVYITITVIITVIVLTGLFWGVTLLIEKLS